VIDSNARVLQLLRRRFVDKLSALTHAQSDCVDVEYRASSPTLNERWMARLTYGSATAGSSARVGPHSQA
jgi:hypothetical protein